MENEDEYTITDIYYMAIGDRLLPMTFYKDTDIEMIKAQTMINLSADKNASKSYEGEDEDYVLIESKSEDDEEDVCITRHPLKILPFKEEWMSKFNNPDYKLVD